MSEQELREMSDEELLEELINSVQRWEISKGTAFEIQAFEAIDLFENELLKRLELFRNYRYAFDQQTGRLFLEDNYPFPRGKG